LLLWDSMCAKNTDTADKETKWYCHYKTTNWIKRHLLVDVLWNPYFVKCTKANLSDDNWLIDIIKENKDFFLNLEEWFTITLLLDNWYHKDFLEKNIKEIDSNLLKKIKIEISKKITPEQKNKSKEENPDKNWFVVQAKRWIVERTNAWINQCRSLWKNCEWKLSTSEIKIKLCSIRLILRRLA
jgi:transposase